MLLQKYTIGQDYVDIILKGLNPERLGRTLLALKGSSTKAVSVRIYGKASLCFNSIGQKQL